MSTKASRQRLSKEFGVPFGSKKYENAVYAAQMKQRYGYLTLRRPKRCKLCRRKATIIHAETGLTMQCFQMAQSTGRACDGTPMFELMATKEQHLAIEAAAARNSKLRTIPAEIAGQ